MCATANPRNETDESNTTTPTIEIVAAAYDANTEGASIHGTKHIRVNGKVLCGRRSIQEKADTGEFHVEETEYPLSFQTCKNCISSYLSRYGSRDEAFEAAAKFEEGDWIEVMTPHQIIRGRVRHPVLSGASPQRSLTIVASDEPTERWLFGTSQRFKIRLKENEYEVAEESVASVSLKKMEPPAEHIDQQTAQICSDLESQLEDLNFGEYGGVKTTGRDLQKFAIQIKNAGRAEVQKVRDALGKEYTVESVTYPWDREHSDYAGLSIIAEEIDPDEWITTEA